MRKEKFSSATNISVSWKDVSIRNRPAGNDNSTLKRIGEYYLYSTEVWSERIVTAVITSLFIYFSTIFRYSSHAVSSLIHDKKKRYRTVWRIISRRIVFWFRFKDDGSVEVKLLVQCTV